MENARSGTARARATLEYLRDKITSGQWPIDSKIPIEPELEKMVGVGRTTIREAVRSLASLGMLETAAGRGTFVRSRTPASSVLADFMRDFSADELLSYKRALEVEGAQQAALNRTDDDIARLSSAHVTETSMGTDGLGEAFNLLDEFHTIMFEATHSALLAALYRGVIAALRSISTPMAFAEPADVLHADHKLILEAIVSGNPVKAAHAMALHADRDINVVDEANDWAVSYRIGGLSDSLAEITRD